MIERKYNIHTKLNNFREYNYFYNMKKIFYNYFNVLDTKSYNFVNHDLQ